MPPNFNASASSSEEPGALGKGAAGTKKADPAVKARAKSKGAPKPKSKPKAKQTKQKKIKQAENDEDDDDDDDDAEADGPQRRIKGKRDDDDDDDDDLLDSDEDPPAKKRPATPKATPKGGPNFFRCLSHNHWTLQYQKTCFLYLQVHPQRRGRIPESKVGSKLPSSVMMILMVSQWRMVWFLGCLSLMVCLKLEKIILVELQDLATPQKHDPLRSLKAHYYNQVV